MNTYLYVLSIGPVQDFIAAARRTRDLWIGSHLLSEISKAAAKKIIDERGILIFPSLEMKELEPSELPDAPNVANIILAVLKLADGENPADLNKRVKDAAQKEWEQYSKGAKCLADLLSSGFVNQTIWEDQVADVLEFYSAWVPLPDEKEAYQATRKRLMKLLAGRKSSRDFRQAKGYFLDTKDHYRIPKSSLDGARETIILKKINEIPKELALKTRLKAGEQLCAVGLTKRLGGIRLDKMKENDDAKVVLEVFPSVVRVALDPWIRGVIKSQGEAPEILKAIGKICRENMNKKGNISQGTGNVYYQNFPFDGQVLHISRIISMTKAHEKSRGNENGWEAYFSEEDIKNLGEIKPLVERLQKNGKTENGEICFGFGEPERYYAVLVADGDYMGKVISTRKYRDEHICFSACLSRFAKRARAIVKEHNGCLVYSGGDDVLAFLPIDCCLQAARELHDCFGNLLKEYKVKDSEDEIAKKDKSPTLSVGIAIGHSMEPLEDILSFGKEAEKAAKTGKNAKDERDGLAVHIYPRSGVPIKIRAQWKPKNEKGSDWAEKGLDERLLKWAEMHCKDELPDSAAYDMHELAEDYKNWDISSDEKDKLRQLIAADILRLLRRKRGGGNIELLKKEEIEALLSGADPYEAVRRLADEMILARRLAAAMRQANGKNCEKMQKQGVAS